MFLPGPPGPGPFGIRLALVLAVDAAAIAYAATRLRRRRSEAAELEVAPGDPAVATIASPTEAERPSAEEAVQTTEEFGARSRLARIRKITASFLESDTALLARGGRIQAAWTAISALSDSLAAARGGSDFIRENVEKIYGIANNLANSAEAAFNLSRKVEKRAADMAGELSGSLAETTSLLEESKRISGILTIMSDIASTTNILSFNASIVAANAGGHGKPFAVVAKEMRKLSESTESSLKAITSIVLAIQDKVKAVSDRIRGVNDGVNEEKEALVAVAGNLQGVMLANEVVRTVSDLCKQKSEEELERLRSMAANVESAAADLVSGNDTSLFDSLSTDLRKVAQMANESPEGSAQ